jgi:hypothetical protein
MALIDELSDFAIDNEISTDDWCDAVLQLYAVQSLMALEESSEDSWEESVILGDDVVTITSTVKKMQ